MPIHKIKNLRKFLATLGTSAKKSLSQNFLIDENILNKIVQTILNKNIDSNTPILEIGPGPGALTEKLLENTQRPIIAIEKDTIFSQKLNRLDEKTPPQLKIYNEDILKFSLDKDLSSKIDKNHQMQLVGNLPYSITSPILAKFLPRRDLFSEIIVMMQKEVAIRVTAKHGSKNFSHLSLFCQFFSHPQMHFTIKAQSFFPKPKVESALVHFKLQETPKVNDIDAFFSFTRSLFQHKRKMLRSTLKKIINDQDLIIKMQEELDIDLKKRPESISLSSWVQMYNFLLK